MCLDVCKSARKKTATKDIVVYKLLRKGTNKSVYMGYTYKRGRTVKSELFLDKNESTVENGLHSFAKEIDAKIRLFEDRKVVRMVIPKGAKYYKGTFGPKQFSYASDTLYWPKESK